MSLVPHAVRYPDSERIAFDYGDSLVVIERSKLKGEMRRKLPLIQLE